MIKTILSKENYLFNPVLETDIISYNTPVNLFGNEWLIMDDYWMKHVHLKITDKCNAKCPFCIEKNSNVPEKREHFIENVAQLLKELNAQNHLTTVSITGGEPSICSYTNDVVNLVKGYNCFLNINTNGYKIIESIEDPDWINISCHVLGKDDYCKLELDPNLIYQYRLLHPSTKIRIQCVLHDHGLKDIKSIMKFIKFYKNDVDDFSFRRLISLDKVNNNDLFQQFKFYLFDNAKLVEQVLKDYYVYETWDLNGSFITLSHSNMGLLKSMEANEPDNLLREIVVHPDGLISGSWYRDKKIISY